jgi:hypothetical protein
MEPLELLDQIKRTAVVAIASDDRLMERLVLKGGNALDLIYGISLRASLDLDFSCNGDLSDIPDLQNRLQHLLDEAFAHRDLRVIDLNVRDVPPGMTDDVRDFWGGVKIDFKLTTAGDHARQFTIEDLRRRALVVGDNNSTRFNIDISNHEFTDGKVPRSIEGYRVFVYTPAMIVCEKLRAICQQLPAYGAIVNRHRPGSSRARDFVDLHLLCEAQPVDFQGKAFHDRLRSTFLAKRVPLGFLGQIESQRDFHAQTFTQVQATMKAGFHLRDFDFYFAFVLDLVAQLQPLWVEDAPS